jgi:hypothetical protein
MRFILAALPLLALAACAEPYNPPLVSTQSPPGTGIVNDNAPLQTLNSLPPGAANLSHAPGGTWPDFASIKLRAF